jgi:hypothetical protein
MRHSPILLLLAASLLGSRAIAGSRLTALPPRPGMRLTPSIALEWGDGAVSAERYARGTRTGRQVLARLGASPGGGVDSWSLTFDPAGVVTVRAFHAGQVVAHSSADPVGPFLGRMPAAIEVESGSRSAEFNGESVAVAGGTSGRLYVSGAAEPFTVSGSLRGAGRVRVTLYGLEGDRSSPLSLLPAAGLVALGELDGPGEEPVPEPSALVAFGALAWWAAPRLSARPARRAGRPRRAAAGRTRTR